MRWDAARVASRRELPKPRNMMGPVGPESFKRPADGDNWCDAVRELGIDANKLRAEACTDCGYHICSCEPAPAWKPTCMYCGAEQEDRGSLKTRMICVSCAETRKPKHPNGCPCAGCTSTELRPCVETVAAFSTFMPPADHETHVRLHNELRAMIAAGRWTP